MRLEVGLAGERDGQIGRAALACLSSSTRPRGSRAAPDQQKRCHTLNQRSRRRPRRAHLHKPRPLNIAPSISQIPCLNFSKLRDASGSASAGHGVFWIWSLARPSAKASRPYRRPGIRRCKARFCMAFAITGNKESVPAPRSTHRGGLPEARRSVKTARASSERDASSIAAFSRK